MSAMKENQRTATAESTEETNDADLISECPECDGTLVNTSSETYCDECGLVTKDDKIDPGPEWRAYSAQEEDTKSRVGRASTQTLHDKGLSTVIGNISTKDMGAEKKERLERMKEWDTRVNMGSSKERGLQQMLGELQRMTSELDVPDHIHEGAAKLCRRASDEDLLKGRSFEGIASAALVIHSRIGENPLLISQVDEVSRIEQKRLSSAMKYLRRQLNLEVPPPDPVDHIHPKLKYLRRRIAKAGIDYQEFHTLTERILEFAKQKGIHTGRRPLVVVGGAVYFVATKLGIDSITQDDLAEIFEVSVVSIRKTYAKIKENR